MSSWADSPALATDCVIFHDDAVVLIKRKYDPYKGYYALPGGAVEVGETVEDACRREMREEIGLEVRNLVLVGVYSRPDRDPRGHTVSIVYLAEADISKIRAGSDAAEAELVANWNDLDLAFDHGEVLADAWKTYRASGS